MIRFQREYNNNGHNILFYIDESGWIIYVFDNLSSDYVCEVPEVIYSRTDDFYYPFDANFYNISDINNIFNIFMHEFMEEYTGEPCIAFDKVQFGIFRRILHNTEISYMNGDFHSVYIIDDSKAVTKTIRCSCKRKINGRIFLSSFYLKNPEEVLQKIENHELYYISTEYFKNYIEITDHTLKSKIRITRDDISLNDKMMYILNKNKFKNLLLQNHRKKKAIFVKPKLEIFHKIISGWDEL